MRRVKTYIYGAMSGDATIANSGAVTIAANAVEIGMIECEQTTISDSDAHYPTSGAVVDYVAAQISPIGGFEVIATEVAFPNTQPSSGVVISISDAGGVVINGSGVSTTGRTAGGATVAINGSLDVNGVLTATQITSSIITQRSVLLYVPSINFPVPYCLALSLI